MPKSCRDMRRDKQCTTVPYVPYPETGLTMFVQSIKNAIARKNIADKTKNTLLGRALTRSKNDKKNEDYKREADIRGVLKNLAYSKESLKDYTVSSVKDAIGATARSVGHSAAEFGRRVTGNETKNGTFDQGQIKRKEVNVGGGRKSRRYHKRTMKSSKQGKRTRKNR